LAVTARPLTTSLEETFATSSSASGHGPPAGRRRAATQRCSEQNVSRTAITLPSAAAAKTLPWLGGPCSAPPNVSAPGSLVKLIGVPSSVAIAVTVPSALASSAAMPGQQLMVPIVAGSLQVPAAGRRAQRSRLPSPLASQTAMNSPSG